MNLKVGAFLGVVLAAHVYAAAPPSQQSAPSKAASEFIPLSKDIQCTAQGLSFTSVVGQMGQMVNTDGAVDRVTCWIVGKTPELTKDIPLASNEIKRGMLSTKDFGKLKIIPTNSLNASSVNIAIRRDKFQSFRAFLQKADSPNPAKASSNTEEAAGAFVPLPDDIGCWLRGLQFESVVGSNKMDGSADGMTCWIGNKVSARKKDVALASSKISDRMLATKDFGNFKLGSENNLVSPAVSVDIRRDKLQLFRDFLARESKELGRDDRFIAYEDGTALDTKTNLMWAAKDNATAVSWPDAKSFSENYRGGGFTDWRLPTLDELKGLYDATKTYKSNCDSQLDNGVVVDDVHLSEFIRLTCIREWTSQGRSGYPGSAIMFDFHYGHDTLRPGSQGFIDAAGRVLPVREAAAAKPQQQAAAPKTGSIAYSRVVIRNGALVLKDVHDSFEGDGWIAGTVVSSSAKALVVSVSGTVLASSATAKNKEYTVAVDEKTSGCIAQKPVASSLMAISGLPFGQRVSVAFRKGTQTADRIVDQSYEIVTRMATPLSASPSGPSMPECD